MIRLILVFMLVLTFVIFRFVPWYITLGVGITLILLSKFLMGSLLLWLFSIPFRAKGKVLRGASVEIHSLRRVSAPVRQIHERTALTDERPVDQRHGPIWSSHHNVPDEDQLETVDDEEHDEERPEDEDTIPRDYYEVDVTITPRNPTGPFFFWDYGDLTLCQPGKKFFDDDDSVRVEEVRLAERSVIIQNRQNELEEMDEVDDDEMDAGGKIAGPHRLIMVLGVKQGIRHLVFNYYFEKFGKLEVP